MKRILLALAIVPFLFASCEPKTKTIHVADFTVTYPASLEVLHSEDNFPNSAALYLAGENNQLGMYSIVYYSDDEMEYLDKLHAGLENFLENKIVELLNTLDGGGFDEIYPNLSVDDFSEIEWNEDKSVAWLYCNGTYGEDETPWKGGITIYFNGGALVKLLGICNNDEEYDELEKVMLNIEFDNDEGYEPDERIAPED